MESEKNLIMATKMCCNNKILHTTFLQYFYQYKDINTWSKNPPEIWVDSVTNFT